jgi:hypothetical protein
MIGQHVQMNGWLIKNVYPFVNQVPAYLKMSKSAIAANILSFLNPNLKTDIKLYRILFCL